MAGPAERLYCRERTFKKSNALRHFLFLSLNKHEHFCSHAFFFCFFFLLFFFFIYKTAGCSLNQIIFMADCYRAPLFSIWPHSNEAIWFPPSKQSQSWSFHSNCYEFIHLVPAPYPHLHPPRYFVQVHLSHHSFVFAAAFLNFIFINFETRMVATLCLHVHAVHVSTLFFVVPRSRFSFIFSVFSFSLSRKKAMWGESEREERPGQIFFFILR